MIVLTHALNNITPTTDEQSGTHQNTDTAAVASGRKIKYTPPLKTSIGIEMTLVATNTKGTGGSNR